MKFAGTAFVKVDGQQIPLAGTLTVQPFDKERETKMGLSGVAGYKETLIAPWIEVEGFHTSDVNLTKLHDAENVTVQADLPNGKIAVVRNAWSTKPPEINVAEGTFSMRFEGKGGKLA